MWKPVEGLNFTYRLTYLLKIENGTEEAEAQMSAPWTVQKPTKDYELLLATELGQLSQF